MIEPYGWSPGLYGRIGLKDLPVATVDQSPIDILKKLDWGIFLRGEVRKGRWGFLGDGLFAQFSMTSDPKDAVYDDVVNFNAADIEPTVTWGITPGQAVFINQNIPSPDDVPESERATTAEALEHMKFEARSPIKGKKINVAFLGSCTNGRYSDFVQVAKVLKGHKVAPGIKAIAVPGSQGVQKLCESQGIDQIFRDAGFEWRDAGCSMCLAMNPDKLVGDQLCASSSNRNFKGRQGSVTGRTLLMSPIMVAAAAVTGEVSDAREVFAN
jgi:3-isopropylmalate/(R)-2-methylmalate dehydratase large subunit